MTNKPDEAADAKADAVMRPTRPMWHLDKADEADEADAKADEADGAVDANKANAAKEANVIGKIIVADEAILIDEDAFYKIVEAKGHG